MKVGVVLPHAGRVASASAVRDVVEAAEGLGYSSLWAGEHIILPGSQKTPYPYSEQPSYPVPADRNFIEAFTTLSYASAVSQTASLGISVCVVPYRRPLVLAKILGSLDMLTEGRFIFGAGSGWLREEYEALSVSFDQREAFTDEVLSFLDLVGKSEGAVSFSGEFVRVDDVEINPRPHASRVPVWVGGRGRVSRARAVRFGDAWHPPLWKSSPEWLRKRFTEMESERQASGRPPLLLTLWAPLRLSTGTREEPWTTGALEGTVEDVTGWLRDYRAVGVEHVVLAIGGSIATRLSVMEQLATSIRALAAPR